MAKTRAWIRTNGAIRFALLLSSVLLVLGLGIFISYGLSIPKEADPASVSHATLEDRLSQNTFQDGFATELLRIVAEQVNLVLVAFVAALLSAFLLYHYKSKRRWAKRVLESEGWLSLAVDGAKIGLWGYDIQCNIIIPDDSFFEMMGLQRNGTQQYTVDQGNQFVHPKDQQPFWEHVEKYTRGEIDSFRHEMRLLTADGHWKWVLTLGKATDRDADGVATRIVGLHIDIDQLKRAEITLHESEQRVLLAIESTGLGMWELTLESNQLTVNNHVMAMLGYPDQQQQALSGSWWTERIHPDDLPKVREQVARHVAGETARYEVDCRMQHVEGHWIWMHSTGRFIMGDDDGVPDRMIGFSLDITDRMNAEQIVRTSEQKYRMLGDFSVDWDYWENAR